MHVLVLAIVAVGADCAKSKYRQIIFGYQSQIMGDDVINNNKTKSEYIVPVPQTFRTLFAMQCDPYNSGKEGTLKM